MTAISSVENDRNENLSLPGKIFRSVTKKNVPVTGTFFLMFFYNYRPRNPDFFNTATPSPILKPLW